MGEGTTNSGSQIYNNSISNLTRTGTVYALYINSSSSPNYPNSVFSNTVTGITSNGASSAVYGGYIGSGSTSAGLNFFKNIYK